MRDYYTHAAHTNRLKYMEESEHTLRNIETNTVAATVTADQKATTTITSDRAQLASAHHCSMFIEY